MSALLLEKNRRMSLSQRTKHIKGKYFLIKDYYDAGVIDVKFCPTNQMWADVLTKPLQGQKFRDMPAFLQNCPRDYEVQGWHRSLKSYDAPRYCFITGVCWWKYKIPTKNPNREPNMCLTNYSWQESKSVLGEKQDQYISSKQQFAVGHTRESAHGKIKKFNTTSQPHNFPIPSKGQTKAGRGWERQ